MSPITINTGQQKWPAPHYHHAPSFARPAEEAHFYDASVSVMRFTGRC